MKKVKIRLVQLGYPPVDLHKVEGWSSELFEFDKSILHRSDLPNSDGKTWALSKRRLAEVIGRQDDVDVALAITDRPIERDYYMHRLSGHVCVMTFYDVAGILSSANLQPETFIIRNIYEVVSLWQEFGGEVDWEAYKVHHEDTRGCLYDFNADKRDLVRSTERVRLCPSCKARLLNTSVPLGFVDRLENELKRIKKSWGYRLFDFVKAHPFIALAISATVSLALNLTATVIYEAWLKGVLKVWGWVN
jgi:hypothetical protein